ncbi:MAG: tetratricopeptide repeat protein, partial [Burkholderiales bacterium]
VRQALLDDPRGGRGHSVLGLIYLLQGRKELVAGELSQALDQNPNDPTAHGWLLSYHHLNGDYPRAHQEVEWLIRHWPRFWPAYLNRGELLREQGDVAGAIREQQRVLEQAANNVDALGRLTRAYLDRGDFTKAQETLDRARDEDRQNYELRLHGALFFALNGTKGEAAKEMDAGLQAYAGMQIFGPALAADFYAALGDTDQALEWLHRAVRMGDLREDYLRRNPMLTSLRGLPRFQAILDAVAYRRQQRPAP